jgi:hypothetical protein
LSCPAWRTSLPGRPSRRWTGRRTELFDCTPGAITSESWLVQTKQIHTTAMLGAARRAEVRRTVHRLGRRGRHCSCGGITSYTSAASVGDRSRRSYRLHSGGSGGERETSRGGAGGGPEPADIEGARSRSYGGGAARARTRRAGVYAPLDWTTCRAAPLVCSDWSEEKDAGRSRLDRVEGGGEGDSYPAAERHLQIPR